MYPLVAQLLGVCMADSFQLLMPSGSTSAFKLRPWAPWVASSQWQSKKVCKDISISIQGETPLLGNLESSWTGRDCWDSIIEVHIMKWRLPWPMSFPFFYRCHFPIIILGCSLCLSVCFLENFNTPWTWNSP